MAYATIPKERLKLVERIARGAFGTVYRSLLGDQQVAAKQVDKEEGECELKFLSKLDHANIVKLLGKVDGEVDLYIILEFCDGGSLRSYLTAHGAHILVNGSLTG